MKNLVLTLMLAVTGTLSLQASAWTSTPVAEDPLVRMPGSQPPPENSADIEGPTRCLNCHGGYDSAVEPAFNWQGSMMAQAARDPIFWACLTVAAQDAIWAVGNPNATDICERCHFPKGWLEGRSDPTNASLFSGDDYDGVQCDVCHSMIDPFFETTHSGSREGSDWLGYWDETNVSSTPSQPAADATYTEDLRLSAGIKLFSGGDFYGANHSPSYGTYIESGSGQMFMDDVRGKRASFADAQAKHATFYSRYHKSKYFCSTCHDVSNPILANANTLLGLGLPGPADQSGGTDLITEQYNAGSYFHVERTFSEFMLSAYGQQGGAATNDDFQAQGAPGITWAAKCQDCHMRDLVGKAASQNSAVIRPTNSVEHPNSGQPVHDLTGGNAWVGYILASTVSGSTNYDSVNEDLLVNQINGPLTLDINQGAGIDPERLLAGVERAKQQLHLAATIKDLVYDPTNGKLTFEIQNNTGHKLISGFPEGRRMFVNIKVTYTNGTVYEVNPYDDIN
ncbi:MAG: multiheme c-type cytochrome, partial [Anaerolineales bacterium]